MAVSVPRMPKRKSCDVSVKHLAVISAERERSPTKLLLQENSEMGVCRVANDTNTVPVYALPMK